MHGNTRPGTNIVVSVMDCMDNFVNWFPMQKSMNKVKVHGCPKGDMDPKAVKQRDTVNQQWVDILYQGASQVRLY